MHVAPELCVSHLMACQDSTPQCVRAVRHTMSMLLAGSGLSANGIRKSDIVELERLILDPTVLAQGIGLFSPSNVVISVRAAGLVGEALCHVEHVRVDVGMARLLTTPHPPWQPAGHDLVDGRAPLGRAAHHQRPALRGRPAP